MVNEAYLNRINESLPLWRSTDHEARQVDGLDPRGLRVDRKRSDGERNAVGNAGFLGVQFEQPGLARQGVRKGPLAELQQTERQCAAEQRGIEQIVQQVCKAEPKRG